MRFFDKISLRNRLLGRFFKISGLSSTVQVLMHLGLGGGVDRKAPGGDGSGSGDDPYPIPCADGCNNVKN